MRLNKPADAAVEESPLVDRRPLLPRHRGRWIALATAIVVVAAGGTFYVIGRQATPVPVDTAVARYRNDVADAARGIPVQSRKVAVDAASAKSSRGPTTAPTRDGEPAAGRDHATPVRPGGNAIAAPGVYVYATQGYEEVSVLGGARHTYPDQTTITVIRSTCGADVRWDGLEQRWDQWTTCAAGHAIQWREFLTYHEFFKQVDRKDYVCSRTTLLRPGSDTVGSAFTGHCEGSGAVIDMTGRVVGIENVKVGATTVRAVRVHIDEKPSGATKGRRIYDSWYQMGTSLLVRRESRTDVDSKSAFGYTHYIERLSLALTSLEPRR
jgi:hypothetical protein